MITEIEHRLHKELLNGSLIAYRGYLWDEYQDVNDGVPWSPLTNVGEAMQLIEIMRKRGYDVVIATYYTRIGQPHSVWSVGITYDSADGMSHAEATISDDSLPLAVCTAIAKMLDLRKPKE